MKTNLRLILIDKAKKTFIDESHEGINLDDTVVSLLFEGFLKTDENKHLHD